MFGGARCCLVAPVRPFLRAPHFHSINEGWYDALGRYVVATARIFRLHARPWLALVAAYALALQAILGGALGNFDTVSPSAFGDAFIICHGADGSNALPDDGSGQKPSHHEHCLPCCLARVLSAAAVPSPITTIALDESLFARLALPPADQVVGYEPPPDRQQRAPPAGIHRVG